MPWMQLETTDVREPEQRRHVIADEIVLANIVSFRVNRDGGDEGGERLLPVELHEATAADPFRLAYERERAVLYMRKHVIGDAQQVAHVIATRVRRQLCRRRPEHLVKIGQR